LSVAYLLLNSASYDGEILHTDAYRPSCIGRVVFYVYWGRRYQKMTFFTKINCSRRTSHQLLIALLHCVRKKHPLTFSFIFPWIICGFKQKLQRIYPRIDRFWQCKS